MLGLFKTRADRFLAQLITDGDLVYDVGAHKGDKTKLYLKAGARVLCVDPQPACVEALQKRFAKDDRVAIEGVGLAGEPGTLELSICDEAPTISTFSDEWKEGRFADYKWDRKVQVPVTTLDALIAKHGKPAYCKIDVEGFELQVLSGLSQHAGVVSIEFTSEFLSNLEQCLDHLVSLGYTAFNFARGEETSMALAEWGSRDALVSTLRGDDDTDLWGDVYAR